MQKPNNCIACSYPKDPPDWHDYQCPMCGCPQDFYFHKMKPIWLPMRLLKIFIWYWWKFKWPELRESYLDKIWWIRNPIFDRLQEIYNAKT